MCEACSYHDARAALCSECICKTLVANRAGSEAGILRPAALGAAGALRSLARMASQAGPKPALLKDVINVTAACESRDAARTPKKARGEPALALRVKRLDERAVVPKRGSVGAAGYDLARCAPPCG